MWSVPIKYILIRSARRTLALQVSREGELIVRAPLRYPISRIEDFIWVKQTWIEKAQSRMQTKSEKSDYSREEIEVMRSRLLSYLSTHVPRLWKWKNLPPLTTIRVTLAQTRWGSCSTKNGLCFSYQLAQFLDSSPQIIDAVIYHELAHFIHKNHSDRFWSLVYSWMPEYEAVMRGMRIDE